MLYKYYSSNAAVFIRKIVANSPCISKPIFVKTDSTDSPSVCTNRKFSSHVSKTDILVEVQKGVRRITLNRPEKKNALTLQMGLSLISALAESNSDENTNVVVLTGNGDYFTSGMDLIGFTQKPKKSAGTQTTENVSPMPRKKSAIFPFVTALIECKKPLIALINGPAVGFGVTMLGLFDAVYCSDRATFHTKFTEYGLTAELCSTYTFPRIMGYGKANQLLMFNRKMNSSEAFDSGLVSKVIPHETFHEECNKRIEEISKLPVKSLIYSKELVRGREREILKQTNEDEQSKFDPEAAREVKRKFEEEMLHKHAIQQDNLTLLYWR